MVEESRDIAFPEKAIQEPCITVAARTTNEDDVSNNLYALGMNVLMYMHAQMTRYIGERGKAGIQYNKNNKKVPSNHASRKSTISKGISFICT